MSNQVFKWAWTCHTSNPLSPVICYLKFFFSLFVEAPYHVTTSRHGRISRIQRQSRIVYPESNKWKIMKVVIIVRHGENVRFWRDESTLKYWQ